MGTSLDVWGEYRAAVGRQHERDLLALDPGKPIPAPGTIDVLDPEGSAAEVESETSARERHHIAAWRARESEARRTRILTFVGIAAAAAAAIGVIAYAISARGK